LLALIVVEGHVDGHLNGHDSEVHHDRDQGEGFKGADGAFSGRMLYKLLVVCGKHVEGVSAVQEVDRCEVH